MCIVYYGRDSHPDFPYSIMQKSLNVQVNTFKFNLMKISHEKFVILGILFGVELREL